jgi:hypothetical protein
MFKKVSHIRPIPKFADTPPKPTIAEDDINVAPYDTAITNG